MAGYAEGNYAESNYAEPAGPSNPSGTFAAVLPRLTASFTGTYAGAIGGSFDAVLPVPTAPFTGTYTQPTRTGTIGAVLPKVAASFAGSYHPLAELGTFTATLPAIVASFTGAYLGPYPTDTSNSFSGLDLAPFATVTLTRATAAPSRAAVKYDKSVPYPPPTLVNGRTT